MDAEKKKWTINLGFCLFVFLGTVLALQVVPIGIDYAKKIYIHVNPIERQATAPAVSKQNVVDRNMLCEMLPPGSTFVNSVDILIPKNESVVEFPSVGLTMECKPADHARILLKGSNLKVLNAGVMRRELFKGQLLKGPEYGMTIDLATEAGFKFTIQSILRPTVGQLEPIFQVVHVEGPEVIR